MANIGNDDLRAISIVASGSEKPEVNEAIKTKLGIDDNDVKAWQMSKNESPEIRSAVETKISTKIADTRDQFIGSSGFKATLVGAGQGASFGFSDEIIAGTKSAFEKLSKGGDLSKIYDRIVKKERAELKSLEDKYPLQFIAGELTGAFLVPIPGTTALKSAKIAGKAVGKGAQLLAESALFSAGKSERDVLSTGFLKDVGTGTALGVGSGALLGKAGRLLRKGGAPLAKGALGPIAKKTFPVKKAAQYVSSVMFDLPIPYTEKLLNPITAQKILNPKNTNEIVEAVVDMTKTMGQHARALSLKATENLDPKKSIRIGSVIKEINGIPAIRDLGRSNLTEAVAAKKAVAQVTEDLLLRSKKFVSEVELKKFVQDLDKEIPWNKFDWKLKDRILGDIRSTIDHGILKKNTAYADAMKPVEILMGNLKDISKSFSLRREGFKIGPTDATFSKAKNFFDVSGISKKPVTERALAKSKEGASILEDIELSQIARRTEGGQAAGSRNIIQGLAAGSLLGLPVIGAVAGAAKDKFGRKIGKSLLPKLSPAIEKSDQILTKALGNVSPDQLERVLTKIGRVQGTKAGVDARSTTLLP